MGSPVNNEYVTVKIEESETEIPGKTNHQMLLEFLRMDEDVSQNLRILLKKNPTLLKYKQLKRKKYTPLLHIAKYNKTSLRYKIKNIACIIDVEYKTYVFSAHNTIEENFLSLFAVAAIGDCKTLRDIIQYFNNGEKRAKLHDCRNGDSVLSFMIKFGNISNPEFGKCFQLLLDQGIDHSRIDYCQKNLTEVVNDELQYYKCEQINERAIILGTLFELMANAIDTYSNEKIILFQKLIRSELTKKQLRQYERTSMLGEDDGEHTLLQLAILKNRVDSVKHLLVIGADPNYSVVHGNSYSPLSFSAILCKHSIFIEILNTKTLKITNEDFKTCIENRYLKELLHSDKIKVDLRYEGKIPLYYAIKKSEGEIVQRLLRNGSDLPENWLNIINTKHLESYFDSCLVGDGVANHIDDYHYKLLVVFDFFLHNHNLGSKFFSEVEKVRMLSSNARLKYLLAHPLIQLLMLLKWYSLSSYYYAIVLFRIFLYLIVLTTLFNEYFSSFLYIIFLVCQGCIIFNHGIFWRFSFHSLMEAFVFLILVAMFPLLWWDSVQYLKQTSALLVILISFTMLLILGYHPRLSLWMAMLKKIFATFATLLALFMIPISAFSLSFYYLIPKESGTKYGNSTSENTTTSDFATIPSSMFRVFIMLSGDIGDGQYPSLVSYLVFILFSLGMAVVLMNFWTGIALSHITEVEEQSTVAATQNVIEYIQNLENIFYTFELLFKKWDVIPKPVLKCYIGSRRKYNYALELYLNKEVKVEHTFFKSLKIDKEIIDSIKIMKTEEDDPNQILMRLNRHQLFEILKNRR